MRKMFRTRGNLSLKKKSGNVQPKDNGRAKPAAKKITFDEKKSDTPVRDKRSSLRENNVTPVRTRRRANDARNSPLLEVCEIGWDAQSPISLTQAMKRSRANQSSKHVDEAIQKLVEENTTGADGKAADEPATESSPRFNLRKENKRPAARTSRVLRVRTPGSAKLNKFRSKPSGIKAAINGKQLLQSLTAVMQEITVTTTKPTKSESEEIKSHRSPEERNQEDRERLELCGKATVAEALQSRVDCLDQSADLFASTQTQQNNAQGCYTNINPIKTFTSQKLALPKIGFSPKLKGNLVRSPQVTPQRNQSCEDFWTDEELFEDESFLLKATQMDMFETPKAAKRKLNHSTPKNSETLLKSATKFAKITNNSISIKENGSNHHSMGKNVPYSSYYARNKTHNLDQTNNHYSKTEASVVKITTIVPNSSLAPQNKQNNKYNFRTNTATKMAQKATNNNNSKPVITACDRGKDNLMHSSSVKSVQPNHQHGRPAQKLSFNHRAAHSGSTHSRSTYTSLQTTTMPIVSADTSITDELLLTLAEPDEELNTQAENALLGSPLEPCDDDDDDDDDLLLGAIPIEQLETEQENKKENTELDCFMTDDEVGEPELLAVLEEAETQATQELMQARAKCPRNYVQPINMEKSAGSCNQLGSKKSYKFSAPKTNCRTSSVSINQTPAPTGPGRGRTIPASSTTTSQANRTLTASQVYSAEQIERKKMEAIKRRQNKSKLSK